MITHDLIQGSDEWARFRLDHFGASEAAAMLGLSPKVKRTELLHMKHTAMPKEFSDWVQENILDYGHVVENMARPIIEELIGEDLYPVTCSDGIYSASCDGLTLSGEVAFEHKQFNTQLAEAVSSGVLPDEFMPQCQQVLMVTGAKKVVFVVSDGTPQKMVRMEVFPEALWFKRIQEGWKQFAKDLDEYQPREIIEKPKANAIIQLPALSVQIRGEVVLSNLPQFKEAAETFIANIKTELATDEDFANAEATVKFCDKAEKDLELTKKAALSQTASIDDLMRTIDYIKDELRTKRLQLDDLVTSKKKAIKEKILKEAREAFAEHVASLEAEIKPIMLPYEIPDFLGAAKNKRTLASLHDAVDTKLANAKISTDAIAKDVRAKLTWCKENAQGYGFLFNDLQLLIRKPVDDFQLVVNTRVSNHKKAEAEKVQAEIDRVKEAELAKLRAEQEAKIAAERKEEELRIQADRDRMEIEADEAERLRKEEDEPKEIIAQNIIAESEKDEKSKPPEVELPAHRAAIIGTGRIAMVTITKEKYESLLRDSAILRALYASGVDNWEGFGDAMASLELEAA